MNVAGTTAVFEALNEAGVDYLVAGGLAVVAHGHVRFTADIDIICRMTEENLLKATTALSSLGYRPRAPVELDDFAKESCRTAWIQEKGLSVFALWSERFPMVEIDLFAELPFDDFERAKAASISLKTGNGVIARAVGLEDLIAMKRAAGRAIDLNDISRLEELREEDD